MTTPSVTDGVAMGCQEQMFIDGENHAKIIFRHSCVSFYRDISSIK